MTVVDVKIKPLGDRIVIRALSTETVTREEINEVKKVISSNEILSIILLEMLEMKLSLQKYE